MPALGLGNSRRGCGKFSKAADDLSVYPHKKKHRKMGPASSPRWGKKGAIESAQRAQGKVKGLFASSPGFGRDLDKCRGRKRNSKRRRIHRSGETKQARTLSRTGRGGCAMSAWAGERRGALHPGGAVLGKVPPSEGDSAVILPLVGALSLVRTIGQKNSKKRAILH